MMSSWRSEMNAVAAGQKPSSNRGWACPGSGKYAASGWGRSLRTRNLTAALASRAGNRSDGSLVKLPSRSSCAAMTRNNAAVSRQEGGASPGDHPAATSRACARISATEDTRQPYPRRGSPIGSAILLTASISRCLSQHRSSMPDARYSAQSSHRGPISTPSLAGPGLLGDLRRGI